MFRSTNPIQAPRKTFRIKWAEVAAFTATCTIAVGFSAVFVNLATEGSNSPFMPSARSCATEDDTNCFWDATTQGNGIGNSFYTDAAGNTYYLPEDTECRDNLEAWTRDASQMIEDMDSRWAVSAPYSASVRTDNIDPMTSRLNYIVTELCS